MKIVCTYCGAEVDKDVNAVNRAKRDGNNIYCGRRCSGLGRRKGKTKAQLVEEKRQYDAEYRVKNDVVLREKKKAYFKRTYDPIKAAEYRKGRMHIHVRYCQSPEYRKWKKEYDQKHRAKKNHGEYWEAYLLTLDIHHEVRKHASWYDVAKENGTLNKATRRKRSHE